MSGKKNRVAKRRQAKNKKRISKRKYARRPEVMASKRPPTGGDEKKIERLQREVLNEVDLKIKDATSVKAMMSLAKEYGLTGYSNWKSKDMAEATKEIRAAALSSVEYR